MEATRLVTGVIPKLAEPDADDPGDSLLVRVPEAVPGLGLGLVVEKKESSNVLCVVYNSA